jgi:hypothetical protein
MPAWEQSSSLPGDPDNANRTNHVVTDLLLADRRIGRARAAGGFVLTRQEAAEKWGATTYALSWASGFDGHTQELRECSAPNALLWI